MKKLLLLFFVVLLPSMVYGQRSSGPVTRLKVIKLIPTALDTTDGTYFIVYDSTSGTLFFRDSTTWKGLDFDSTDVAGMIGPAITDSIGNILGSVIADSIASIILQSFADSLKANFYNIADSVSALITDSLANYTNTTDLNDSLATGLKRAAVRDSINITHEVIFANAGENLDAYEAVFLHSDTTFHLAKAMGHDSSRVIGLVKTTVTAGNPAVVIFSGEVTNSAWKWTTGQAVYLSSTVAGGLTQATLGHGTNVAIVRVGFAIRKDKIRLLKHVVAVHQE